MATLINRLAQLEREKFKRSPPKGRGYLFAYRDLNNLYRLAGESLTHDELKRRAAGKTIFTFEYADNADE